MKSRQDFYVLVLAAIIDVDRACSEIVLLFTSFDFFQ